MKEHTKQMPGKDHETAIKHAEGLSIGSVHPAHTKENVKQAKMNPAPHKASHAQRDRVLSGKGNKMGEGSVTNQETGHGPLMSGIANNAVQKKAHGFNERSQNGNANPSAFADCE